MADAFYVAAFGGIRIWASRVSTVNGRKVVIHDPTTGDEHPTQDRGLDTRVTTCSLLFDEMDGERSTPRERFDHFCAVVEGGEPQIFTHPLRGSYRARVGKFDHELEGTTITAEVEFIPVDSIPAVRSNEAGLSALAGGDQVSAAADTAVDELAAVGMASPAPDAARAAAESWQDEDFPARRVAVDVATVSAQIGAEVLRLGLADHIKLWPAHVAMILLSDALLAAGRAATSDVSRLMTVRIGRRIALPVLLASIYGADQVELRERQARDLNDLRTPGWLELDTELRLPQPAPLRRAG